MSKLKRSKSPTRTVRRPTRGGSNSSSVEKMQLSVKRRVLSGTFIAVSATLLGLASVILLALLWFNKVYANPEHVFWSTLQNSLATQSVTKTTNRSTAQSTSKEFITLAFSPSLRIRDVKVITDKSSRALSSTTIEGIGTASDDYQRYSHLDKPSSNKTQKDYQKIYDSWLKNGGQEGGSPKIAGKNLFGAVLFGDFDPATRGRLIKELKTAYEVDFKSVNKNGGERRRIYIYTATLPLSKYAVAAHDYAQALALPLAPQISPKNYRSTDDLKVNITVDVLSRQVKRVEYVRQGFSEDYSAHGRLVEIDLPNRTVSAAVFQQTLKSLNL